MQIPICSFVLFSTSSLNPILETDASSSLPPSQQVRRHHRGRHEASVVGQLPASRCRGHEGTLRSRLPFFLSTRRKTKLISCVLPHLQRTKAGEMIISPKQNEAEWYRWMDSMQDWCISRQLWWGHRCPAYLLKIEGVTADVSLPPFSIFVALLTLESLRSFFFQPSSNESWVVGRTLEEATARADKVANGRKYTLEQDDDVLDTWFSSGLWPFAIMGWPDKVSSTPPSARRVSSPFSRLLSSLALRLPISETSTPPLSSRPDGTSSSSGLLEWSSSEFNSPDRCPSLRSTATP